MSTLTHKERERIAFAQGLPVAPLLAGMADAEHAADQIEAARCNIDEAKAQFPDEDFAHEEMRDLAALAKCLRGENRAALLKIAEALQARIDEQARASEYGLDELCKALNALEGAT